MIRFFAIACLCLSACATNPPVAAWTSGERNACVPEAIVMTQGLSGAGITAKVLLITTPAWKHAVCVYLYPCGENRLWVWDSEWKSMEVRAYFSAPDQIARAWLAAVNQDQPVTSAEFL